MSDARFQISEDESCITATHYKYIPFEQWNANLGHSERSEESFPVGKTFRLHFVSLKVTVNFRRRKLRRPTVIGHSDERSEEESFPIGKIPRQARDDINGVTLSARDNGRTSKGNRPTFCGPVFFIPRLFFL